MANGEGSTRTLVQSAGLWGGVALALLFEVGRQSGWMLLEPERPALNSMAAILSLMALWWITEAIPIYVTALVPLVLYPALKIPPGSLIANQYGDPLIFLFLGGFLIALAIEESGLHRRVALLIIAAVGDNPRRVILGFMLATAGLSMWISNTATTIMLLPIAASVLGHARRESGDSPQFKNFSIALMLGLAYAASIGGVGTLIGTPPNVMFKGFFEKFYPEYPEYTFLRWMLLAVPYAAVLLAITWALLTYLVFPVRGDSMLGGRSIIKEQLHALGKMSTAEKRMLAIFLTTAALWVLREPVRGWGWAPLLGLGKSTTVPPLLEGYQAAIAAGLHPLSALSLSPLTHPATVDQPLRLVDDGTVAIFMALLCFVIPAGGGERRMLLEWEYATRLPWGILLLFGGGLALGSGMRATGLDLYLGSRLAAVLLGLSEVQMVAVTAGGMTMLTEITSNMASINMLLPVLRGTSDNLQIDPRLLMVPATLASSCAFMLPVATAPNAIVYGSGYLRMKHMIKAGLLLNIVSVGLIVLFVTLMGH